MAFIEKKDPVVLNIKLTTKGRELLSTGNLSFKYYAIGDSEIDYKFNNDTGFNPFNANILRPADNSPKIISFIPRNMSGSTFNAIPSIPNTTYLVTNSTPTIGFFDSTTGATFTFTTDSNHVKQPNVYVDMSGVTGGTKLHLRLIQPFNGQEPATGDTVLIKWTFTVDTTGFTTQKNKPVAMLVYKIQAKTGTLAADNLWITVDRPLPNYTGLGATGRAGALVYYNFINFSGDTVFNMSSTDYIDQSVIDFFQNSQCPTIIFPFWNLSIIFTDEIAGVTGNNKTYGQFNTNGYAGFVSYIQTQRPLYKKLGVIHYTNDSPANVYAEGFYLNSAKIDMPTIMWHNNSGTTIGASFISASGNGFTLVDLGIHYFDLVDVNRPNIKVGKVFDELKIFLIEDQELLYAMSYKSNRSWTLPPFTINGGSGGCPPCPSISDGQTLFVQTIIGTPGSIKNTGGRNIVGYQNVTEYGVEYKLTGATDWTRIVIGNSLAADNFTYTITGTTPSASYNYRSYVKIGKNEFIDHSNDNNVITMLPPPVVPPPPPPPIIPTVATIVGNAGIGRIINTGGFNIGCTSPIPQSVFVAVEKYGMQYKLHTDSAWSCSPAVLNAGPLAVDNFSTTIAGLTECACYDYAALIQVAGIKYCGACNSLTTCASPAPVLFVPTVTTGVPFKLLSTSMITKNNYVNDNGGTAILEYGVLYSQNPATPLIYGNAGVGKASIVGDYPDTSLPFTMTISPLTDSSTVNYRAFAINSAGIGYGDTANTTTPAIPAPPQQALLYITNSTQLGANTDVRSCICGKLAVTVPLTAGQTVRLCFTDCAYSQSSSPLQRQISACSWITTSGGVGATQCNPISSVLPINSVDSCSNESTSFVDITSDNIANITLWTVATSHASNVSVQYHNVASVNLAAVVNSGGANYTIGTSLLQAYNTSCCVGGGGGATGGGTSMIQ